MDNKVESTKHLLENLIQHMRRYNPISKYNYGVISNNIEKAVNRIEHIILAEKCE